MIPDPRMPIVNEVSPAIYPTVTRVKARSGTVRWMPEESTSSAEVTRHVSLEAVHNFRDLGGYPTAAGARVRQGVIYRADGLHRLTDSDLEVVSSIGIRTVVDLRTHGELAEHGTFPAEKFPVEFHHVPIIDATWQHMDLPDFDDDADFLHHAYTEMLAEGRDKFARAFEIVAGAAENPVVYHCAAGKDRTGLLTMMILGVLGVSREHIVADFALTDQAIARLRRWLADVHPEAIVRMDSHPSHYFSANPRAMERVLEDVERSHGGVAGLVGEIGVSADAMATLRAQMTEPA